VVVQAGILQGEVESLMVMDQWQASLMRALAQLQLKSSSEARSQVQQKFDMEDGPGFESSSDQLDTSRQDGEDPGASTYSQ